jgi:photosystem II stability/assembly factor-like uncharacterized protein
MKHIILSFLFFCTTLYSQCIYWEQQSFPVRGNVSSIQFFDLNTGYTTCLGSSTYGDWNFIKTTNGGINWVDVGSGVYQALHDLSFINKDTGYIGGLNYLARTINGGLNWTRINLGANNPLGVYERLKFFDVNYGIVFGGADGKRILKTTNGAMSWDTILHIASPYFSNKFALAILNKDTIIVGGGRTLHLGFVIVTHNGGMDWHLTDSLQMEEINGVSFLNNSTGILAGSDGKYLLTTNTGLNWSMKETGFSAWFSISKLIDTNTYFLIDYDGGLCFTTNSGINWTYRNCFNFLAGGIFFINQQTGWVGGNFGNYISGMFKTTNGGLTFINQSGNSVPQNYNLSQNYPNPFNPVTKIKFSLLNPSEGGAMSTRLIIYDVLGREVVTLLNEQLQPGSYSVDWDAANYPSGVYFYKLETETYLETKKMVLIK